MFEDILLPDRKNIKKTNTEDPIDYYYWPFIGYVYKKRLINTLKLMGSKRWKRLVEIGYGSGLLFPELAIRSNILFGIDTHKNLDYVYQMTMKEKIDVNLTIGNVLDLKFDKLFFDCIVSVSLLEHIENLDKAFDELGRVLSPEGRLFISFPVKNKITNLFYKLMNYDPDEIHPSSHTDIIAACKKKFMIEDKIIFPKNVPLDYALYVSLRCSKKGVDYAQ
ncbi:MAG: class I SAM-dependent methyltransferase [Pseudomonadota bacterium]